MAVSLNWELLNSQNLQLLLSISLFSLNLYTLTLLLYNTHFHSLSHIPGPLLARTSGIPYTLHIRAGTIHTWIHSLHETYGEVVRVGPGECSFIGAEAWQGIYGFHKQGSGRENLGREKTSGRRDYVKDHEWFPRAHNGSYSMSLAEGDDHSRMRRCLSYAFSERALREQESLIQNTINLLISRLKSGLDEEEGDGEGEGVVDMTAWYNWTTVDVISLLTFGEPLHCLKEKAYEGGAETVLSAAKAIGLIATSRKYPMFAYWDKLRGLFADSSKGAKLVKERGEFFKMVTARVEKRIDQERGAEQQPDFLSYILKNNGVEGKGLTRPEIVANSALLLVAGSETTATTLCGATYLLLTNPRVYDKVVSEIRSRFASQDQITIEEVNKLEYLIAVLQEALRYYPPVATGFPRVVPQGGDTISSHYIPGGTSVYVSQHAASHSLSNFADPDEFVPERWLKPLPAGYEKYRDDRREVVNAFSFGPRSCLGKNLAYAEMRLIMAKMLFTFDMKLDERSRDWMEENRVFTLWEKPELFVKLSAAK